MGLHRRSPHAGTREAGVTLIELMVVLVIVGILAAVGYPAYVKYSDRARRSDGKALLSEAAARMERYYFDHNAYTTLATDLGYGSDTPTSAGGNYTLVTPIAAGATGSITTSYLLVAQPTAAFNDTDCGSLTLDVQGTQGLAGTHAEDATYCWGK